MSVSRDPDRTLAPLACWVVIAYLAMAFLAFMPRTARAADAWQPLPACWPGLDNGTYVGTGPELGESADHRWVRWFCIPKDPASGLLVRRVAVVGLRSLPITTIFGRMQNIENSTARAVTYSLMWKAYVTLPLTDPSLAAGVAIMEKTP